MFVCVDASRSSQQFFSHDLIYQSCIMTILPSTDVFVWVVGGEVLVFQDFTYMYILGHV